MLLACKPAFFSIWLDPISDRKPDPLSGVRMYRSRFVVLAICMAFSSNCFAADWLQFRGPNANGVTNDSVAPD
ncbi:MAG: hypothetical protein ACK6EB_34815, partial [Planctomyces sp.]